MSTKQEREQERDDAIATLRDWIKPGATVYTSLNHVSASGMSRSISLYIVRDGEIRDVTYWAARALGDRIDPKRGGIVAGGCGMDMGFGLVYSLGRTLYREGFRCTGKNCPSNDHHNPPYPSRDGRSKHRGDGGYSLNHRWI